MFAYLVHELACSDLTVAVCSDQLAPFGNYSPPFDNSNTILSFMMILEPVFHNG